MAQMCSWGVLLGVVHRVGLPAPGQASILGCTMEQHRPAAASWEYSNSDVLCGGQVPSRVASGAWLCLIQGCPSHWCYNGVTLLLQVCARMVACQERDPSSHGPELGVLQLSLNEDARIQPALPARSSDLASDSFVLVVACLGIYGPHHHCTAAPY